LPSAVIRDFSYDAARNELTVTLTTDKTYVYSLVPAAVAEAFAAAAGKGAFFNEHIRDRFPFRKAEPAPAKPEGRDSLRDALRRSLDG
jgi:lysyl-tRNA synthetase class 2